MSTTTTTNTTNMACVGRIDLSKMPEGYPELAAELVKATCGKAIPIHFVTMGPDYKPGPVLTAAEMTAKTHEFLLDFSLMCEEKLTDPVEVPDLTGALHDFSTEWNNRAMNDLKDGRNALFVSVDGRAVKHGARHDDTKAGKLLAEEDVLKTLREAAEYSRVEMRKAEAEKNTVTTGGMCLYTDVLKSLPDDFPQGARAVLEQFGASTAPIVIGLASKPGVCTEDKTVLIHKAIADFGAFVADQLADSGKAPGDLTNELMRDMSCPWNDQQFAVFDRDEVARFVSIAGKSVVHTAKHAEHEVAKLLACTAAQGGLSHTNTDSRRTLVEQMAAALALLPPSAAANLDLDSVIDRAVNEAIDDEFASKSGLDDQGMGVIKDKAKELMKLIGARALKRQHPGGGADKPSAKKQCQ